MESFFGSREFFWVMIIFSVLFPIGIYGATYIGTNFDGLLSWLIVTGFIGLMIFSWSLSFTVISGYYSKKRIREMRI